MTWRLDAQQLTRDDIDAAARRINGLVRTTPVVQVEADTLVPHVPVLLKLEALQHTGSFKPRGAFNRVLHAGSPGLLVAASGGNHALAVAYVARRLRLRAELFVPASAPAVKVAGIRALGAQVTLTGASYAEALQASTAHAGQTGALMVHAYDHPDILAGQGTVARELLEQAAGVDTVVVAAGGGGLIGGIATWCHPHTRVVCVEPAGAPTLHAAITAGAPVDVTVDSLAADSLGARRAGTNGLAACLAAGVEPVLVTDDAIRHARALLWARLRIVAEPGGATALAALTSGAYRPTPGERIAVIVCGANTDSTDLAG